MSDEKQTTNEESLATAPDQPVDTSWREKVFLPQTYSQIAQDFLDSHANKGVLSRTGNFNLRDNLGVCVPYELCPPRVKRMLQKINAEGDLQRSAFKSPREYRSALVNLHIYGYLHELKDNTLMQKKRMEALYMKRWQRENTEKTRQYASNADKYRRKWRNECEMLSTL